jgi:aminopeptidase
MITKVAAEKLKPAALTSSYTETMFEGRYQMKIQDFETKLRKYAQLIVKVGLNLQPGQRLFIIASSLEVAPLVRAVVRCAYQGGSKLVTVEWRDEQLDKIRYQAAPRDSFEEYPSWISAGALGCIERGDALLKISGSNPELFKDQDPELIAIVNHTAAKNFKPASNLLMKNFVQWSVVCPPTPDWATKVFPHETAGDAEHRLWDVVTVACRLDQPDPISFWQGHFSITFYSTGYRSYGWFTRWAHMEGRHRQNHLRYSLRG